jgi:galactose mutarotase-like enzyme
VAGPLIGDAPAVTLTATDAPKTGPAFLEAVVLPGRGMMLLQAKLRLPSGVVVDALHAPSVEQAAREMDGGPDDFAGNRNFAYGAAILAPFANRITGTPLKGAREIETTVDGRTVRLPRNWGGKAAGAAQYAMHGLILDAEVPYEVPSPSRIAGRLAAGDFGGRWPGKLELDFEWRLEAGALVLAVTAHNVGEEDVPLGLGVHPYLALPSGERAQARLRLPARVRTEVNDYDEVLPTGRLLPVAETPYDFNTSAALGGLHLDDCFTELAAAVCEVADPAAGVGFRIASPSPEVKAFQVYAPPDQAFVVVEPQYNLADPYSPVWPAGVDTGMARLKPGASLTYDMRLTAFALGTGGCPGG